MKKYIPEITDVVQVMPGGKELTTAAVEEVLKSVRPFIEMAGGSITILTVAFNPIQTIILLDM